MHINADIAGESIAAIVNSTDTLGSFVEEKSADTQIDAKNVKSQLRDDKIPTEAI